MCKPTVREEREKRERTYGHDEGVAHAGDRVRDLVAKLDVMVVEPTSGDGREPAVEAGDARLRKETGEDVANQAADGVGREDLRIITKLDSCRRSEL